jgi:hypothetical protein
MRKRDHSYRKTDWSVNKKFVAMIHPGCQGDTRLRPAAAGSRPGLRFNPTAQPWGRHSTATAAHLRAKATKAQQRMIRGSQSLETVSPSLGFELSIRTKKIPVRQLPDGENN